MQKLSWEAKALLHSGTHHLTVDNNIQYCEHLTQVLFILCHLSLGVKTEKEYVVFVATAGFHLLATDKLLCRCGVKCAAPGFYKVNF